MPWQDTLVAGKSWCHQKKRSSMACEIGGFSFWCAFCCWDDNNSCSSSFNFISPMSELVIVSERSLVLCVSGISISLICCAELPLSFSQLLLLFVWQPQELWHIHFICEWFIPPYFLCIMLAFCIYFYQRLSSSWLTCTLSAMPSIQLFNKQQWLRLHSPFSTIEMQNYSTKYSHLSRVFDNGSVCCGIVSFRAREQWCF